MRLGLPVFGRGRRWGPLGSPWTYSYPSVIDFIPLKQPHFGSETLFFIFSYSSGVDVGRGVGGIQQATVKSGRVESPGCMAAV